MVGHKERKEYICKLLRKIERTTTVELDGGLDGDLLVDVFALEGRSELLLSSVEIVDIGYKEQAGKGSAVLRKYYRGHQLH